MRRVESMVEAGDKQATLVYDAMLYQIGKTIGAMASVLDFRPDGIILTGGMANSGRVVKRLQTQCAPLAPIHVYPGSDESLALAQGAARALAGEETPMTWPVAMPEESK